MTEAQKKKKRFRNSKKWKEFRHTIHVKFKGKDPITGKKLLKGSECHHLDLNEDNYDKMNEDNFIPLNKLSHKFIHWSYGYYREDRDFVNRLKFWLDKMLEINNEL